MLHLHATTDPTHKKMMGDAPAVPYKATQKRQNGPKKWRGVCFGAGVFGLWIEGEFTPICGVERTLVSEIPLVRSR